MKKSTGIPLHIDWEWVDGMLRSQCDGVGIAGLLGMHPKTLYRRCLEENGVVFREYRQRKMAEGKELLRAKQWDMAMKGDKTMLVWLGKQYLGQKENRGIGDEYNLLPEDELNARISKLLEDPAEAGKDQAAEDAGSTPALQGNVDPTTEAEAGD